MELFSYPQWGIDLSYEVQCYVRCPFDKRALGKMEKNPADQRDLLLSSSQTNDAMDLLSIAFQSVSFVDTAAQQEDFKLDETVSESRKRSWQSKEEPSRSSRDEQKFLKTISLDEVAWHDTLDNCWVVIHDFVYDCTDFLKNHPGGSDVILEYAGRDATLAFIGTGHSKAAVQSLERYLIGELPPEERIFRVPNGVKVVGF